MDRRSFLKGPVELVQGVVQAKKARAPQSSNSPVLNQSFLTSLDALLEKHRKLLVEELSSGLKLDVLVASSTISPSSQANRKQDITIDDSTFVIEEKLDGMEKGFTELAKTETTQDSGASSARDKLRSLKKGN